MAGALVTYFTTSGGCNLARDSNGEEASHILILLDLRVFVLVNIR